MLSPDAALLMANGFCTVRLAQGSQLIAPECSQDSLAAALANFPHPSIKGETHEIICTVLSKQATLPTAQKLAPDERGEAAGGWARKAALRCKAQSWNSKKKVHIHIYMCRCVKLTFLREGSTTACWEGRGTEHSLTRCLPDTTSALGYVPRPPRQRHPRRGQMAAPQRSIRTMTRVFLLDKALVLPASSRH